MAQVKFRDIQCPVCLSPINGNPRAHHSWRDQNYDNYLCDNCQLGFWYPLVMPGEGFYEADAEILSAPVRTRHTIGSRRLGDNHLKFFEHHASSSGEQLLDIGCGDGHFLEEAQKRGYLVSGLDFDSRAYEVAKKRGIIDIFRGNLDEYVKSNQSTKQFDLVTFFEVLEHQASPLDFLESVKKLLKPGGWIAGSVPNAHRLKSKQSSNSDRPPYHFTQWFLTPMLHMLNQLGFKEITVISVGTGYYALSLFNGINQSAKGQLLREVDSFSLEALPVGDAAQRAGITGARLATIHGLRELKALSFAPVIAIETLIERIWNKGQYLYFEGKL